MGEEIPVDDERFEATVRSEPAEDGLKECTYILKIQNCDVDDVGQYTLKLKNKYGEGEASVSRKLCNFSFLSILFSEFLILSPTMLTG